MHEHVHGKTFYPNVTRNYEDTPYPMPSNIKHIVFDFGGVIINLTTNNAATSFRKFLSDNTTHSITADDEKAVDALNLCYEIGGMSHEQFRNNMQRTLGISVAADLFDHAWNSIIADLPKQRISLLHHLREQYHLSLLSNTNAGHLAYINRLMQTEHGTHCLDDLFDRVYYSHLVGMRKPSPEIFTHVLSDSGITAAETLFIDDLAANTTAAAALGIQTLHLIGQDICEALAKYI